MNHEFEIVVIGAGPAGIAAAVSAAEHDMRVALVDDNPSAGGQIWRTNQGESNQDHSHGSTAAEWRNRLRNANITSLHGWSVFDQIAPRALCAESRGEMAEIRFDKLILATGARERFLPFPGWTLPGVIGVGALQAMVKTGLPIRDARVVIAGSGPLLLAIASALQSAGARVICICEQASVTRLAPFALSLAAFPGKIAEGLRYKVATRRTPYHTSSWPIRATGTDRLQEVTLSIGGKHRTIPCDYLACGFHLVPNVELPALLGCTLADGAVLIDEWQCTSIQDVYCAGEPTGISGLELSLIEGQIAGLAAALHEEKARSLFTQRRKYRGFARRLAAAFALRPELKTLPEESTLLCRCEDVPYGAVRRHHSWRSAKLQTRCGMGPCQGRVCGSAAEFLLGWTADYTRPPIFPVAVSSLACLQSDRNANIEHTHAI